MPRHRRDPARRASAIQPGGGSPEPTAVTVSRLALELRPRRDSNAQPLIRRFLCGHPDPFRSVRDLGLVSAGCTSGSEASEGCSSVWLPAWLPARAAPRPLPAVFKSVRNSCPAALLPGLSAAVPTMSPKIIPCISRAISTALYHAAVRGWCSRVAAHVAARRVLCACALLGVPGWFMRTSVMVAQIQRSPSARATAMRWCPSST